MAKIGKNKGGRPQTELTAEQIQEVEKLAGSLNIKQIADYLDISVATFHRLKAKDSDVLRAYKKGVAHKIHHYAQLLESKADGSNPEVDATSTIFFLKTKAGWGKEEKTLKIDISEDATPLEIVNKAISEMREGNITSSEVKQLTDLAQVKQQLLLAPSLEQAPVALSEDFIRDNLDTYREIKSDIKRFLDAEEKKVVNEK